LVVIRAAGGLCGSWRVVVLAGRGGCWYEWGVGKMAVLAAVLAAVLGVIALTLWAAVVAGLFRVAAGAVLTALASVAAGYVPGIREALRRPRAELERLEAAEAADQEELRRSSELPGGGPAGLLDPRRELVGFTGREDELKSLLAWCRQDPAPRGVRLAAGGVAVVYITHRCRILMIMSSCTPLTCDVPADEQ
jgi:hypothetical protein